ncbi:MAG: helix-turn-helix transcriptional regulator [Kofleriaceae bacterium]
MSKKRHLPDGPVWVRTHPVTYLHDRREAHRHDWHQLTYALRGQLELVTADARRVVPADRAVWVPAGTAHVEVIRAPLSMRSLYVAPGALPAAPPLRTVEVAPLLREVILHVTRLGALDRRRPSEGRLALVLFDLIAAAPDVALELPLPRDPRARAFAELVADGPGDVASIAQLARRAGASVRTLERLFLAETGVAVGVWRRRMRLFHALRLLEAGRPVTAVALEVGYATTSAFTAAFTRAFGRTPTGRRRDAR